jgi:hypothetical protein
MELFICRHCGQERKSKKSLIGHETFCKNNLNSKIQTTEAARLSASAKVECIYCNNTYSKTNIKKHQKSCIKNPEIEKKLTKSCPVCGNIFISVFATCSYSCSNAFFRHGRQGGARYLTDEQLAEDDRYRDLCFRHHGRQCIVCKEENIVTVHHLNEDHSDNRAENLVPLCPTHHQYYHSRYRNLIEPKIQEYILKWKNGKLE